jgi:hypothetical protein
LVLSAMSTDLVHDGWSITPTFDGTAR